MSIKEEDLKFLLSEKKKETKWEILANHKNILVYRNPKETLFTFKAFS